MELTKKMRQGIMDWANWKANAASPWDMDFDFADAGMYAKEFSTGELFGYRRAAQVMHDLPADATLKDYENALAEEIGRRMTAYTLNNLHKNSNWVTQTQLKGAYSAMMNVMNFAAVICEN